MTDELTGLPEPEHIEAIREALVAARESLKAAQKQNDQIGVAKLTRVVGELGSRLARSGLIEKQKVDDEAQRSAIIQDIIRLIEAPILDFEDLEERKQTLESVKWGEEVRYRTLYGKDPPPEALSRPDPGPEPGENGVDDPPDSGA
jgi:hypothetical protein